MIERFCSKEVLEIEKVKGTSQDLLSATKNLYSQKDWSGHGVALVELGNNSVWFPNFNLSV